MRKTLFAFTFLALLLLPFFAPSIPIFSQSTSISQSDEDFDDSYTLKWLRHDLKVSDVVVYVNVTQKKLVDSIGQADCENDKGNGYCLYELTAEVKEIFKGKIMGKTLKFYTSSDATYPKKYFMGEQIVFLVWGATKKDKTRSLGTIENSTRKIEALEKMRRIVDSNSTVDDNDESDSYSMKSIQKEYGDANAVIYAEVTNFKPDEKEIGFEPFILEAKVIQVFKGNFKVGQIINFKDDLLYRPLRTEDLGKQVVFLEKDEEKKSFKRLNYTISDIQHNILEKLKRLSKTNKK